MANYNKVGVLGGMGPLATVIFYKKVIDLTNAKSDQDNVNMVILNDTCIPDRTEYLLDNKKANPYLYLKKDVELLESCGCDLIVMPCNTAHFFYKELNSINTLPFINMVDMTLKTCFNKGQKKLGVMATVGTVSSHVYDMFNTYDLDLIYPDIDMQNKIEELIYDYVKKNIEVPSNKFKEVTDYFFNLGVDGIILGCTELSVIHDYLKIDDNKITDSTIVLAEETLNYINENKN